MDPNAALRDLLSWAEEVVSDEFEEDLGEGEGDGWECECSSRAREQDAAEMFLGLHQWLVSGGFLPDEWRGRRA